MQQQYSIFTNKIIAVILITVSIPVLITGIGGVMSYPNMAWKIGAGLLASASLILYGAFASWKQAKAMQKSNTATEKYVEENKTRFITDLSSAGDSATHIKFIYTAEEWITFSKWEKKERKINTFIEAGWIVLLGAVVLNLSRSVGWSVSFLVSGGLAAVYYSLKVILTNAYLKSTNAEYYAIVTPHSLIINGKVHVINDGTKTAGQLKLITDTNPQVLEFTYHWNTRRGSTYDEIRIPVPAAQTESAKALVEIWNKPK